MQVDAARLMEENAPEGFLKALYDAIGKAYRESKEKVSLRNHFKEDERNVLPYDRRASVEGALKQVAIQFGLPFEVVQLGKGKFWATSRIRVGKIVLDAYHVHRRRAMVRRTEYRETSAESNQPVFEFMEKAKPLAENALYAIVLHGEDKKDPSRLAYLDIAVPDHELATYVDYLDLVAMFGKSPSNNILPTASDAKTETEDDLVKMKRQGQRKKNA